MRKKRKNLKILTVIRHARKHLEDGNRVGAIESVRSDTDYSPMEAKTLVEFIELFTEADALIASRWCEEHRVGRFKCVNLHPEAEPHTDKVSAIQSGGINRDYAAEAKALAEFIRSVSVCNEHHVTRSECARLHQETKQQPPQPKPAEATQKSPPSVPKCACGDTVCDNQWHRLAMWIHDNPFEWLRVLEELTRTPSQVPDSARAQDENRSD